MGSPIASDRTCFSTIVKHDLNTKRAFIMNFVHICTREVHKIHDKLTKIHSAAENGSVDAFLSVINDSRYEKKNLCFFLENLVLNRNVVYIQ